MFVFGVFSDVSEHLMESCNLNSINSEDKLTSSSEYLSENSLNGIKLTMNSC